MDRREEEGIAAGIQEWRKRPSALRQVDQIVLGHLMVEEKSNEFPAAPELIEALGLRGCVLMLDAEHAQKKPSSR